jgi:hypothetical protein
MSLSPETGPLEKPLEYLLEPLQLGRRRALQLRKRRGRVRVLALAGVGAAVLVGSAAAAIAYLGQPAPPSVKQAFRANNAEKEARAAFMDDVLHVPLVNVNTARTVAISGDSVLYGAQGASGNYCTVLLRKGQPARDPNVRCELGVYPIAMRVDYKQLVSPREEAAPLVLSGRLSGAGRTLRVRYANGLVDRVPVGLRGYFVYQPTAALQRYAKTGALRLVERDRRGTITDTQLLQPPIILSQSSPISPQLAQGRVFIAGAKYVGVTLWVDVSKNLSHPRGPVQFVSVGRDGRFVWHAPKSAPKHFRIALTVLDRHFRPLVDLNG